MQKMNKVILHLTSLEKGGAAQFTFDYHRQMLAEGYESYVAVRGHKCLFPDGTWHSINHSSNKWERFTCHPSQDTLAVLPHNPDVVYVHWVSDYANATFLADIKASTQAHFYVFSNDMAWCRKNLLGDNIDFVDWNMRDKSFIDMYLKSQCQHHIIANSSFSWWTAWLNTNPQKEVIAPHTWFFHAATPDIHCKGWIAM